MQDVRWGRTGEGEVRTEERRGRKKRRTASWKYPFMNRSVSALLPTPPAPNMTALNSRTWSLIGGEGEEKAGWLCSDYQ